MGKFEIVCRRPPLVSIRIDCFSSLALKENISSWIPGILSPSITFGRMKVCDLEKHQSYACKQIEAT